MKMEHLFYEADHSIMLNFLRFLGEVDCPKRKLLYLRQLDLGKNAPPLVDKVVVKPNEIPGIQQTEKVLQSIWFQAVRNNRDNTTPEPDPGHINSRDKMIRRLTKQDLRRQIIHSRREPHDLIPLHKGVVVRPAQALSSASDPIAPHVGALPVHLVVTG